MNIIKWLFAPKPIIPRDMDVLESLKRQYDFLNDPAIGEAIAEIERLREALKEQAESFTTKSSNHKIAAQEILDELARRIILARAALKEGE